MSVQDFELKITEYSTKNCIKLFFWMTLGLIKIIFHCQSEAKFKIMKSEFAIVTGINFSLSHYQHCFPLKVRFYRKSH